MEKKFKELYLAGEVEFEAIDDYSYDWGMSDEECTLREYLGLDEAEEMLNEMIKGEQDLEFANGELEYIKAIRENRESENQ